MKVTLYHNDLPEDFELEGDLAIDTETMGLELNRDRLCLVQISNGDGNAHLVYFHIDSDYDAPNLVKLLSDPDRMKIFHFARFDIAAIYKYLGVDIKNIFCTKVASRLARTYTEYHGLKDLCREFLDVNLSKQQQCSYWGAEKLSNEQKEYAAKDVIYLHEIKGILQERLIHLGRDQLANNIFGFLMTRAKLDLMGWQNDDILAH
jgi:ribonuclease D